MNLEPGVISWNDVMVRVYLVKHNIFLSWESNIHNAWSQHNNKYPIRVIQILRRITTLACKLYFNFFKLDSTCITFGPIPLLCCHCRIVLRMQFIKRSETLEVPLGCIRSGYHTLILARIIYSLFMSSILKVILANNKEMFFFKILVVYFVLT